jgi:hypothetical protein
LLGLTAEFSHATIAPLRYLGPARQISVNDTLAVVDAIAR